MTRWYPVPPVSYFSARAKRYARRAQAKASTLAEINARFQERQAR